MNLKKLQKAAKIAEKIKALDAEIIELDKIAMKIANGDTKISFDLNVFAAVKEEPEKLQLDTDGSLPNYYKSFMDKYMVSGFLGYGMMTPQSSSPTTQGITDTLKSEISEGCALRILGLLLADKHYKREQLLLKLSEMGVQL